LFLFFLSHPTFNPLFILPSSRNLLATLCVWSISPLPFFLSWFLHCSEHPIIMASPVASAALKARVRNPALLKKLARPQDLMHHFPNGSYIGWSGFTAVGYPK
jgi:cellulose synthase/poly-beta-1,6-N-acetylglucosamine synthase-like glycosyltransferase